MPFDDARQAAILDWLKSATHHVVATLEPAAGDASQRRYFRANSEGRSLIIMDAPPPRERVEPFLTVAGLFREAGVQTPRVHAADPERGFVLLDDFGDRCYLDELDDASADRLYGDALAALLRLQTRVDPVRCRLPAYDEALLRRELEVFREWCLQRWLKLDLRPSDEALLEQVWQRLVASALEQPQVCVHRDFHSRNLMLTEAGNPGVLDFQDAVVGPITYDAVSLLRDCYIAWPAARVQAWLADYHQRLTTAGLLEDVPVERFQRWFDLMGMQRHLKAIGIFARLHLRDGKSRYLTDIPRTLDYVLQVAGTYPEFFGFLDWLETWVKPGVLRETAV